jgi:hypothetical protein
MKNYSLVEDSVFLPAGAYTKAKRLWVIHEGSRIFAFSQGEYRHYLYPVHTPSGFAVTTESPLDHPHHNSFWIASDHLCAYLPFVDKEHEEAHYNFYVNETFQGRAPGRIISKSIEEKQGGGHGYAIRQSLVWRGPPEWGGPQGRGLATEERVYRVETDDTATVIDLHSRLKSREWKLRIGPTRHAYFGVRLIDSLRPSAGAEIRDSEGNSDPETINRDHASWVDCTGEITANQKAGVTVIPKPFGPPLSWFVRDWGLVSVNPFRDEACILEVGAFLDFQVRVIIHDGAIDEEYLNERRDDFKKAATPE